MGDIKDENIKIFRNTILQINNDAILTSSVVKSVEDSKIYTEKYLNEAAFQKPAIIGPATVRVTKNSSFNAARNYGGKIAVLNFASATNPGGGVTKGSTAQEECLCRCSTLYPVLSNVKFNEPFYKLHKEHGNALHNDDIIYSPNIHIIKSDNYNNLYRPFVVDVITCAAPNLRETPANAYNHERGEKPKISDAELLKLHENRGRNILRVAAEHGNETVILGAFGCGAFKNKPEIVAQAYKNILPEFINNFKNIEFAVFCGRDDTNYNVFKSILG